MSTKPKQAHGKLGVEFSVISLPFFCKVSINVKRKLVIDICDTFFSIICQYSNKNSIFFRPCLLNNDFPSACNGWIVSVRWFQSKYT